MKRKRNILTALGMLIILFTVSACSGYGKLSTTPRSEQGDLLADLVSRSNEYVVYYHGYDEGLVSGIVFDPRYDDKVIRPEGFLWKEIDDPEAMTTVIESIDRGSFPGYFQQLYTINNEFGEFYGYLYTGWSHITIKHVDEQTLRVYGLRGPPEYADANPGGP